MNKPSPRPPGRPLPGPRPSPQPAAVPAPAPQLAQADDRSSVRRLTFGPDHRLSVIAVPGAAFALLIAILGSDPVQRTFSAAATVALLAIVIGDLYFAPRLTVTDAGVRVYAPFDRATLAWGEIDSIEARNMRRYGLVSSTLEISAGERLIVLDKRDLKGDPWAVAGAIAQFRFTR